MNLTTFSVNKFARYCACVTLKNHTKNARVFGKKMQFIFDGPKKVSTDLIDRITRCCEGLVYISETDAPVELFAASAVETLDADTMLAIAHVSHDTRIEEREFKSFFARLQTKKFLELKNMLEENLSELRVFKI